MRDPAPRPCAVCPFRRASLAGYLGADDPEHFVALAMTDAEMPCHDTVDYERKDWKRRAQRTARQCAGRAIFLANQCKLPRTRVIKMLPPDNACVFTFAHEFLKHHREESP